MKLLLILLGAYLLLINLDAFILMASDKSRARRGKRRIPEATLFLVAVLGGSPGIIAGMYAFRHKTQHDSFTIGMPLILFFEAVLIALALDFARGALHETKKPPQKGRLFGVPAAVSI